MNITGGKITNDKIKIAKGVRDISKVKANMDWIQLKEINVNKSDLNKRIGSAVIDYYMFAYRLDVITYKHKDINFYDWIKNPSKYLGPKGIIFYKKFIKERTPYNFYTLYVSSVSIFKPLLSKYIYKMFKPHTVLDPTMGWGGRLIGAMAIPNIKYIGFDTNTDLIKPYKDMVKDLKISDRCNLYFSDSAKADLSKFKYDMVFTSPPYYTSNRSIETYEGMPNYKDVDDWYKKFFYPVFNNAYKHMDKGGYFCINTNVEGFELLKRFLGAPNKKININNTVARRGKIDGEFKDASKEYIYVWIK